MTNIEIYNDQDLKNREKGIDRNTEGRRERGRGKSLKSPNYHLLALFVCELMVAVRQRG
jgi:hypothetical protein